MTKNILLILFLLTSCGGEQKSTKTTLEFVFPAEQFVDTRTHGSGSSNSDSNFALPTPTSMSQINCVGVIVNYAPQSNSYCTDTNEEVIFYARQLAGSFNLNQPFTMEVESGFAREFYILGFRSTASKCPNLLTLNDSDQDVMSVPLLIGKKTVDLPVGSQTVSMTLSLTGSTELDECDGPVFDWDIAFTNGIAFWDNSAWDTATWGQ